MLKTGDDASFAETAEKLRDAVFEHIEDEEITAFPNFRKRHPGNSRNPLPMPSVGFSAQT